MDWPQPITYWFFAEKTFVKQSMLLEWEKCAENTMFLPKSIVRFKGGGGLVPIIPLNECTISAKIWDDIPVGSSNRVRGGDEKHQIYATAFSGLLAIFSMTYFYDLFMPLSAPCPLDPLLR